MIISKANPRIETTTYYCPYLSDFKIDIVKDYDSRKREAWIYHSDFGTKRMIYGEPMDKPDQTYDGFLRIVFEIALEHARYYIEDIMEGE